MTAFVDVAEDLPAKANGEGICLAPSVADPEAETGTRLDQIGAAADQAFVLSHVPSSATVFRQAKGWCSSR